MTQVYIFEIMLISVRVHSKRKFTDCVKIALDAYEKRKLWQGLFKLVLTPTLIFKI